MVVHLADVGVLDLLVLTAGPVQVVRALLLRDPVQDEVVRRARVLLFDRLCKNSHVIIKIFFMFSKYLQDDYKNILHFP